MGCENEIQEHKYHIYSLQKKPIPQVVVLLYTPNDTNVREQQFETKAKKFKCELDKVQSDLKSTPGLLQQKENEHLDEYKNNVSLLKKYNEEKTKLKSKL